MPKVPREQWGEYGVDPDSEEYSPSMGEIREERKMADIVGHELSEIEYEIGRPSENHYTGEIDKFNATDPESYWSSLGYLRVDYLEKIKDPELRKTLEDRISEVERKVYKQYIPFIESNIYIFGWSNSPLEEDRPKNTRGIHVGEVLSHLDQAQSVLEHFKLLEEKQIIFSSELDRLNEKLERYIDEPTLFTFEKIEEELQNELFGAEYSFGRRADNDVKVLDDEGAREATLLKFDMLLGKGRSLEEIADKMLKEDIKERCVTRAKSLYSYAERLKGRFELPRELFAAEAELKDLFQRIKGGEQVDVIELDGMEVKLESIREKSVVDRKFIEKLTRLFELTKKAFAGEDVDEEDEIFFIGIEGTEWAWELLGVRRSDSKKNIKRAYCKLATKYHPDRNKSKDTKGEMQRINEAYEFIKRIKGFK